MIDIDELIKIIAPYDVVTFDVFDTLIIRDVMKPTDLFRVSYGWVGRYLRVIAEILARKLSKSGEVRLEDIENYFLFSCKKEIEYEKKLCRANPKVFDLVNILIKQGKKVYAISDMYLGEDIVSEILQKSGYSMPVFVSCDYGCDKKTGDLFTLFLEKTSYNANQVIHIGDDKNSDIKGAEKAGITAIQIDKHKNELSYIKYGINTYEYAAFINHGICEIADPVEKIGYEIVGPIILSFCQWIHEKYKEQGFERLYFLARDMRFTYERYKEIYPEDEAYYLCVSRKSLASAKEHPKEFIDYLYINKCYGNIAVVDTGWVGGTQTTIEYYAKQIDSNTDLGGLYLGTKLAYRKIKRSPRSFSFMFSSLSEQFRAQLFPPFMETLIGSNEKQVVDYKEGLPVFSEAINFDETDQIKIGAACFISDWIIVKHNKTILPNNIIRPFEGMFYNPRKCDMELMMNLHYEDFKNSKIISYREGYPYWKHPKEFLAGLQDSGWKGGYLKRFGVFFPFFMIIYAFLGALRLYASDINQLHKSKNYEFMLRKVFR